MIELTTPTGTQTPGGDLMKPVVAIDAHKASCTYVVRHWDQTLAGPTRISSTTEALTELAKAYPDHEFVFEASGVQEWMMDHLRELDIHTTAVVAPKKGPKGKKSDGEDALRLARKHQASELTTVYVATPQLRTLRDQVHQYIFLKGKRKAINGHLKALLNRWDHQVEAPGAAKRRAYTLQGRCQVLERFPHAESIYEAVDALDNGIKKLTKRLEERAATIPEVQRLRTVKGIGPIVSLALYVEIGTITRFPKAEALVSYFGLDPVHGGSGDKKWDAHRISKKGVTYVRGLLTQGAWAHITHCPESDMTQKYRDVVAKGTDPQKAIIMVERKLVKAVYWMLRQERDFMITGPAATELAGSTAQVVDAA